MPTVVTAAGSGGRATLTTGMCRSAAASSFTRVISPPLFLVTRASMRFAQQRILPVVVIASASQAGVDGGRRNAHQLRGGVLIDVKLLKPAQDHHQLAQYRGQPLTGWHAQHRPAQ